jgi:hypothetical protein
LSTQVATMGALALALVLGTGLRKRLGVRGPRGARGSSLQREGHVGAHAVSAILALAAAAGVFWGATLSQPMASATAMRPPPVEASPSAAGPTTLVAAILVATTAPTTTAPPTTTTTVPQTTTTTVPQTTTTTVPPTTQPSRTTIPRTSTTAPATTTTTLPVTNTSSSSTALPWIVAALVILAVLGIGIYLIMRRSRNRRMLAVWRRSAAVDVDEARTARALLPTSVVAITDDDQWRAVQQRVEDAARSLERTASSAPTEELGTATQAVAYRFRALVAALEAGRLLHRATPSPSAQSLITADDTVRSRWAELDQAFNHMVAALSPTQP